MRAHAALSISTPTQQVTGQPMVRSLALACKPLMPSCAHTERLSVRPAQLSEPPHTSPPHTQVLAHTHTHHCSHTNAHWAAQVNGGSNIDSLMVGSTHERPCGLVQIFQNLFGQVDAT